MHIIVAVLLPALLVWAEPASAQVTHTASVSVHRDIKEPLSSKQVEDILKAASHVLKVNGSGHTCPVTFELKGPVGTFGSKNQPKIVKEPPQLHAVHAVDADKDTTFQIKVVEKIEYCIPGSTVKSFTGCAWPAHLPSIIVVHPDKLPKNYPNSILWAHEFGHLTGLSHQKDADENWFMRACGVTAKSVKVTEKECGCLLKGPEGCGDPEAIPCPPKKKP